jgi:NTE family protein
MSEETWLGMFAAFAGQEWPSVFRCTAVDTADGSFRLWDRQSGVDVQPAVASSCAVPGIFPPVSIQGRRWMDGGVRDLLNADAAAGHEVVVAVSCTVLQVPPGFSLPGWEALLASTTAQLDALRDDGTKVEVVVPSAEMLEISGWGLNLMDFGRAGAAYEAGVRQGTELAGTLGGVWTG